MTKKFAFIIFVVLCTFIVGCTKNNTKENSVSTESSSVTTEVQDNDINTQEHYTEILIQRNNDCFRFQNNEIVNQGIGDDINNLLWIVLRGGAGITDTGVEKADSELPVIIESNNFMNKNLSTYTSEKDLTWVRLIYDVYKPQEGINDIGHKDIMIYLQPDNSTNAILGIQNPDDLTKWTIITMPDYGMWLTKEIDILLRIKTGL